MEYVIDFDKEFFARKHGTKKFSNKHFFSKCDQVDRKLRFWSRLLKKS